VFDSLEVNLGQPEGQFEILPDILADEHKAIRVFEKYTVKQSIRRDVPTENALR